MAEDGGGVEPSYHLLLEPQEVALTRTALNLLITDEGREPPIRPLAREVIAGLEGSPDERGVLSLVLTPQQMKITHSALSLLHDDLRYEHADEREALRRILDKLPDEHTMRAIQLD